MALSRFSSAVSRSSFTLPPTVITAASGVPVARGLNLKASGGHDAHDTHGESSGRTDFSTVPKWAINLSLNGNGLLSARTHLNAPPTRPFQQRFYATSSAGEHVPRTPFAQDAGAGYRSTSVPNFQKYTRGVSEAGSKNFSYFMVGTMGLITAAGAKSLVSDFLANMSASADVLALAKVEVDMNAIPEGKNVIIKWRGKPVFIRHRTKGEIDEANAVDVKSLRDPQKDSDRTQRPEWLVMLGVCTHLGCVPIGEAGDFGGWYCPCHGSHYDISGRVRRGPAPLNLEVPEYSFADEEGKLIVG